MIKGRDSTGPPSPSLQYKAPVDQQLKNLLQLKLLEQCDMFASKQPFFADSIGSVLTV
jgi:hypothetical protein